MSAPTYGVEPTTAFVDVPYGLAWAWATGGFTWGDLEAANGLPAAVLGRLTASQAFWCVRVVRYWPTLAAYRTTTGARGVAPGHAWLGPGPAGGIRYLTGAMDAPVTRVGQRGRWRW